MIPAKRRTSVASMRYKPPRKPYNAVVVRARYSTTGLSGSTPIPSHSLTVAIQLRGITNGTKATAVTAPKACNSSLRYFSTFCISLRRILALQRADGNLESSLGCDEDTDRGRECQGCCARF